MKDAPDRTEETKRMGRMGQMAKLRIQWEAMGEMANVERALAAGTIQDLMDEVERLRAERDEARRLVCELASEYKAEMFCQNGTMVPKSDRALAKAYGWDCFKEQT